MVGEGELGAIARMPYLSSRVVSMFRMGKKSAWMMAAAMACSSCLSEDKPCMSDGIRAWQISDHAGRAPELTAPSSPRLPCLLELLHARPRRPCDESPAKTEPVWWPAVC